MKCNRNSLKDQKVDCYPETYAWERARNKSASLLMAQSLFLFYLIQPATRNPHVLV